MRLHRALPLTAATLLTLTACSTAAPAPAAPADPAAAFVASQPPATIEAAAPIPFEVVTTDGAEAEIPSRFESLGGDPAAIKAKKEAWRAAGKDLLGKMEAAGASGTVVSFVSATQSEGTKGTLSLSSNAPWATKAGTYRIEVTCYATADTTYEVSGVSAEEDFGFRLKGTCTKGTPVTMEYTYTVPADAQSIGSLSLVPADPVPGIAIVGVSKA